MAQAIDPPVASEVVDISSTNHTFVNKKITAIYCAVAGTVIGRLWGDSVDSTWVVPATFYLLGRFKSVTKTGTTITGAGQLMGCSGFPV